jgi:hypothetical protein
LGPEVREFLREIKKEEEREEGGGSKEGGGAMEGL